MTEEKEHGEERKSHENKTENKHEEPKPEEHHISHHHEHEHKAHHHTAHKAKNSNNANIWMAVSGILGLLLIISFFTGGFGNSDDSTTVAPLTAQEAGDKALGFINENILAGQGEAELQSVEEDSDLYQIKLSIQGQEYNSYVTKDGKLLFPSAVDMEAVTEQMQEAEVSEDAIEKEPSVPEVAKKEKPEVELFVMSHCPFGTQIEKGFLPVAQLLGDKIDYEVKFVYYAMHGKKELDEQLLQYCIQKEQKDKYVDYLGCFLKEGDTEACIAETDIDKDLADKCIAEIDEEYKVTENYEDESTWLSGRFPLWDIHKEENQKYGISGSPSLVVNGQQVSSGRDAASLLTVICAGFEEAPEECSQEITAAAPSPGFGYEPGTATEATCG